MHSTTFFTDNLSFVAAAILHGGVTISRVTFHSSKRGVKVYHLSPKSRAEELFRLYVSDQLKVSPSQLTTKIAEVRYLPVAESV